MLNTEVLVRGFQQQIDPEITNLVMRDKEAFHPHNGVSWYEGDKASEFEEVYEDLWLPQHSLALVRQLDEQGGVTLIGSVGSGKSTLLYGARAIMRAERIPYVNINGHFTNTEADEVTHVIDSAEENGMTIIYDSADYLAGGHSKVRSMPLQKHIPRNLAIMRRLIEFRQNGGNLLLTSHSQDWIDSRAHPDLISTWDELVSYTVPQEIEITIDTDEERARLLQKFGMQQDMADFVAQLPNDLNFLNYIMYKWGDKRYIEWAQQNLTSFQMLKLLGKDNYKENEEVLETLRQTVATERSQEESWEAMLDFLHSKSYLLTFYTKLR